MRSGRERSGETMFQLRPIPIPHPSRKQIIFGSLGSSIGVLGILVTVALAIVETIIHPKRRRPLDLYALWRIRWERQLRSGAVPGTRI